MDNNSDEHIHMHVMCNGCGALPVVGRLYRCVTCADFSLCGACEASDRTNHRHHAFLEFVVPSLFAPAILEPLAVVYSSHSASKHEGVRCNHCGHTVFGERYKCMNCADFDLCAKCSTKDCHVTQPRHVFLKLYKPLAHIATGPLYPSFYSAGSDMVWAWHQRPPKQNSRLRFPPLDFGDNRTASTQRTSTTATTPTATSTTATSTTASSSSPSPVKCMVCVEQEVNCVMLPCGHAVCCARCALRLHDVCPVCRSPIVHLFRLYIGTDV